MLPKTGRTNISLYGLNLYHSKSEVHLPKLGAESLSRHNFMSYVQKVGAREAKKKTKGKYDIKQLCLTLAALKGCLDLSVTDDF